MALGSTEDMAAIDLPLLRLEAPEPPDPEAQSDRSRRSRVPDRRPWAELARSEGPRCLAVLVLYGVAGLLNALALAWVHDRVPRTAPLPDLFFSLLPVWGPAATISEVILFTSQFLGWAIIFWHGERWRLFRRVLAIAGACYVFRALTIVVTQVPVPSADTFCAPQMNGSSVLGLFPRAIDELILGLGLNIFQPRRLCGDLIFSGHTLILTMVWFSIAEYSPRRWQRILTAFQGFLSVSSMICLIVARKHYTLDVVLAYYVTSRTFWAYHSVLAHPDASSKSEWWHPLLRFVEKRS